ncbi:MAG: hypothetical protein WB868_12415, partial [Xanthobacteraceae bacterium]
CDKRSWRFVSGDDAKSRKSYREQRRKGDNNDAHRTLRHRSTKATRPDPRKVKAQSASESIKTSRWAVENAVVVSGGESCCGFRAG